jgi:hypothetical protein
MVLKMLKKSLQLWLRGRGGAVIFKTVGRSCNFNGVWILRPKYKKSFLFPIFVS